MIAPKFPVLANIPHSSLFIPDEIREKFLINDEQLQWELLLLTDRFTDELFSVIAEIGGVTKRYKYSRLVADPERFEDDSREPMMSTDYVPNKNIIFSELKTFNHKGVTVDTIDEDGNILLTDGKNYLYA